VILETLGGFFVAVHPSRITSWLGSDGPTEGASHYDTLIPKNWLSKFILEGSESLVFGGDVTSADLVDIYGHPSVLRIIYADDPDKIAIHADHRSVGTVMINLPTPDLLIFDSVFPGREVLDGSVSHLHWRLPGTAVEIETRYFESETAAYLIHAPNMAWAGAPGCGAATG